MGEEVKQLESPNLYSFEGWRKAVQFVLTENPVLDDIPQSTRIETPLFILNEEKTA